MDLEEQQDSKASGSKDEKNSTEYHYMPETYNECKDRFGIIFHDNLTVSCQTRLVISYALINFLFQDLQKNLAKSKQKDDKLMYFPIEQYPFNSANRVCRRWFFPVFLREIIISSFYIKLGLRLIFQFSIQHSRLIIGTVKFCFYFYAMGRLN